MTVLPFLVMFALMYFLLIVPERKRTKKYNEMIGALSVNDEIVTRGGIVGKIISMEDEYMVIQSGPDRSRLKFVKSAIAQKVTKTEQ